MRITTDLPDLVHSFQYVKNHHWIELEDVEGRKTKLHDNGMLRYECPDCQFFCFTPHSSGTLTCPVCRAVKLTAKWQRLQVCFVPEQETDFSMTKKSR